MVDKPDHAIEEICTIMFGVKASSKLFLDVDFTRICNEKWVKKRVCYKKTKLIKQETACA